MKPKEIFYPKYGKRFFDLALSLPALIVLSPLLAGMALLVRAKLGSPVLFRQVRPGLHGLPFTIYKFRTMTDARDPDGRLVPDAQRLTRSVCESPVLLAGSQDCFFDRLEGI